jgi:4-alpha-glucanotransferase
LITGDIEPLGMNTLENAFLLEYHNTEFWRGTIEVNTAEVAKFRYRYVVQNADGYTIPEGGRPRSIDLSKTGIEEIQTIDTWSHAGEYENVFYTDPFQHILLKENETSVKVKSPKHFTHLFKVKAPLLKKNEVVCITGSGAAFKDWDTSSPVLLSKEGMWWTCKINLPHEVIPLEYKYGVYNIREKSLVRLESGENRHLNGHVQSKGLIILHDGFLRVPNNTWKGAGVSIPVFSLKGKNSFGVGEFADLNLLVDWAKKTGLKLIQILPVNDTIATHTWVDSYPYASISAFALHPIYLSLDAVAGKRYSDLIKPLRKKQKQLNELEVMDYEQVLKFKLSTIRELFAVQKSEFLKDHHFQNFFTKNKHWLVPYAAFCYLRDRNGTSDFTKWKIYSRYDKTAIEKYVSPKAKHYNEIALHYFIQYHLHLQLKDAAEYAHKNGIILKGDIPIGVYRYGCDAWMEPGLYHMEHQAGAPPDDFAVKGQNWGFPTYNWEQMSKDGFEWWHKRFVQMSNYYDAFRIDHILGFFRIWSIPTESVEGTMGYFVPAIPVHVNEFAQRNMWFNYHRLCKPYINDSILWEMFGPNNEKFKAFLVPTGNNHYELKPEFDTQRKVEAYFAGEEDSEENKHIKQGLFDLISNVILFEHPGSNGHQFHFRIQMDATVSFRHLDWYMQQQLRDLYVDYFYRRQDHFWLKEAMKKLPALKNSTNMLICGEDLGMVPSSVPEVMQQLGILSLEIQRMPKDSNKEFFHPSAAPYLSVVTPSTHDMSTIRGWWEEDRASIQRFYNNELGQWGDAPYFCDDWINKAIVLQHLYSPAMWSIFQLQDLLGMNERIRRKDPREERINIPAMSKYYWQYRMHLTLEELLKEKDFNESLKQIVEASGR